jgi:hypothetical protein
VSTEVLGQIATSTTAAKAWGGSNLKCLQNFMNSKPLLKDSLTGRLLQCKQTGVGSIKNSILSLKQLALPIMFLNLMHTNKMALLNASIVTPLKSG